MSDHAAIVAIVAFLFGCGLFAFWLGKWQERQNQLDAAQLVPPVPLTEREREILQAAVTAKFMEIAERQKDNLGQFKRDWASQAMTLYGNGDIQTATDQGHWARIIWIVSYHKMVHQHEVDPRVLTDYILGDAMMHTYDLLLADNLPPQAVGVTL